MSYTGPQKATYEAERVLTVTPPSPLALACFWVADVDDVGVGKAWVAGEPPRLTHVAFSRYLVGLRSMPWFNEAFPLLAPPSAKTQARRASNRQPPLTGVEIKIKAGGHGGDSYARRVSDTMTIIGMAKGHRLVNDPDNGPELAFLHELSHAATDRSRPDAPLPGHSARHNPADSDIWAETGWADPHGWRFRHAHVVMINGALGAQAAASLAGAYAVAFE